MSGGVAVSASLSANSNLLEGTGSVGFATTASLLAVSSSQQQISASLLTLTASYTALSSSYIALSASYNTFSGSASTRVTQIENTYATTGSNSFRANQSITGSLVVSSTITAQTLVVQTVTSSIVYSSGSNIFGSQLSNTQTFTGSLNVTGSNHFIYGNVGLGTTSPTGRLTFQRVSSSANTDIDYLNESGVGPRAKIRFGGTDEELGFWTGGTVTERMRITAAGNIGIGTTSIVNASAKLEVKGDVFLTPTSSAASKLHLYNNDSTNETYIYDSGSASNSVLTFAPGGVTKMVVSSSGYIGIGTTTPSGVVEIAGVQAGVSGKNLRLSYNGTYYAEYTEKSIIAYNNELTFGTGTGGTERMRITSAGSVGIGVTNPGSLLQINGESRIYYSKGPAGTYPLDDSTFSGLVINNSSGSVGGMAGIAMYVQSNYQAAAGIFAKRTGTDAADMVFYTGNNLATEKMCIASGGYVGIGTTNPSAKLHVMVSETQSQTTGLKVAGDANGKAVVLGANTNYSWIQSHGSVPLYINELGNNVIINLGGGGVGIGTTNPSTMFDVYGTARIWSKSYHEDSTSFGSNGLWQQSLGGTRFNGYNGYSVVHIKTNIAHNSACMIGFNVKGYWYGPQSVDTDIQFYCYGGSSYVYGFGVYERDDTSWSYGAYYSSDDYVVLWVDGLNNYAGFTLNANNTSLIQNGGIVGITAWTKANTTSAQY